MKKPDKLLRDTIAVLENDAEPVLKVVVKFDKLDDCFGSVDVKKDKFVITLDQRLNSKLCQHFLIHEWAHCLVWSEGSLIQDHGDAWSLVHGQLYRRVMDQQG